MLMDKSSGEIHQKHEPEPKGFEIGESAQKDFKLQVGEA